MAAASCAAFAAEAVAQGSVESDRAALQALYDATGGEDWIDHTNWKTSAPLGEWYGVTTDAAGRVTGLELPGHGLTGPEPAALGRLSNRESMRLRSNELTGPVPACLGDLSHLRSLHLGWNPLTGTLPQSLTMLARLTSLNIEGTAVCAPTDEEFLDWLETIDFAGETCSRPPQPVDAITAQTLTTLGPAVGVSMGAYFNDPDWKASSPLYERFRMTTDSEARVTRLELPGNGLAGPIPGALDNPGAPAGTASRNSVRITPER